jgi:hypothetical protein
VAKYTSPFSTRQSSSLVHIPACVSSHHTPGSFLPPPLCRAPLLSGPRCERTQAPGDTVENPRSAVPLGAPGTGAAVDPDRHPTAPSARDRTWLFPRSRLEPFPNPHRPGLDPIRRPFARILSAAHLGKRRQDPAEVLISPLGGQFDRLPDSRDPSDHGCEKSTFPIFNRKGGLCGRRVPLFYTFSTPVDEAVDKPCFRPAKRPSFGHDMRGCCDAIVGKDPQIPHFYSLGACGKYPFSSLQ